MSDPKLIQRRLKIAESALNVRFPDDISDFIAGLEQAEVNFGEESWYFQLLDDEKDDPSENDIVRASRFFREDFGLQGAVIACNDGGDELVLLPESESGELQPVLYVMMHETGEIKYFARDIKTALAEGPLNYFWNEDFVYKLEDEELVEGNDSLEHRNLSESYLKMEEEIEAAKLLAARSAEHEEELFTDEELELRSKLDSWIDEKETGKSSEIISGLEKLTESKDKEYRIWSLNKLSDLYLRGFGPLAQNLPKSLQYNEEAMKLDSHKAYSNRAACYFSGTGVERDLQKALEYANKANELSKSNIFASALATRPGGGMYDELVDFIEAQIRQQN